MSKKRLEKYLEFDKMQESVGEWFVSVMKFLQEKYKDSSKFESIQYCVLFNDGMVTLYPQKKQEIIIVPFDILDFGPAFFVHCIFHEIAHIFLLHKHSIKGAKRIKQENEAQTLANEWFDSYLDYWLSKGKPIERILALKQDKKTMEDFEKKVEMNE